MWKNDWSSVPLAKETRRRLTPRHDQVHLIPHAGRRTRSSENQEKVMPVCPWSARVECVRGSHRRRTIQSRVYWTLHVLKYVVPHWLMEYPGGAGKSVSVGAFLGPSSMGPVARRPRPHVDGDSEGDGWFLSAMNSMWPTDEQAVWELLYSLTSRPGKQMTHARQRSNPLEKNLECLWHVKY